MSNPELNTGHYISTSLAGVSCPTVTSCMAVGGVRTGAETAHALVEHWNGHRWSIMTGTPNLSSRDGLAAVSCANAKSCVAVGGAFGKPSGSPGTGTPERTLVEHWIGRGVWKIMNGTPSPPSTAQLNSVSCPAPTDCFAIGQVFGRGFTNGLVEHWNGRGAWQIMNGTIPNGDHPEIGAGITCPTTTMCFAARADGIATWNGSGTWQITTNAPPDSTLTGITCDSPTSCTAVGDVRFNTLIERYG
jgi:hypothetical protein